MLVDSSKSIPDWQKMLIDRISADPHLVFVGTIEHASIRQAKRSSVLFSVVSLIERLLLAKFRSYVQQQPVSEYNTLNSSTESLAGMVKALNADIVLNSTQTRLSKEAISQTSFGEWWFNFSEERDSRSDWFGYEAILRKAPSVNLAILARDRMARKGQIASAQYNTKPSGARNNASVKERAVTLLMREFTRVRRSGLISFEDLAAHHIADPPTTVETCLYAVTLVRRVCSRFVKRIVYRNRLLGDPESVWTLFTGQGTIDNINLAKAVEIQPTADSVRADPFLFEQSGHTYLFHEAYSRDDSIAHIAVARFNGNELEELGPVLKLPHHVSYPFVFSDGEEIYMMPETHKSKQIEVWKCVEFPLKWELYSTAFHGRSTADSVLVKFEDKWWLFTNLSDYHAYEDHCCELYVFQVDGPSLQRIIPHRANPVVVGSSVARNAGRIVEKDGKLFRPSQRNEYGIYGYALNIMEVTRLTLDEYEERCVEVIEPDFSAGLLGCHHFDCSGDRFIVDARMGK